MTRFIPVPNRSRILALVFGLVVAVCSTARAADPKYIVVRLDEIRVIDAGDGREGEIQWVSTASTGRANSAPVETQQFVFPMENWYEAREDGVNATFPVGVDLATPIFAYPEAEMGDELVLAIGVADEDSASDFVIVGHEALGKIGTLVAGYFLGPGGAAAVEGLSSAIQKELERGEDKDVLGTLAVILQKTARDGSTFGMRAGEHARTFERQAGNVWFKYTVRRIAMRESASAWCATVKLNKVKIVDDSDDGTQGAGDVYVRARSADGFVAGESANDFSQLNQKTFFFPRNGTRDVHTGGEFLRGDERGMTLYTNSRSGRCQGLPIFLYLEVDVFEDDSQADCSGRTCDDILGVLPLMFNQAWLRDHTGSRNLEYNVRGDDGKARINLTLDIWDPGADPDAPVAGR